MKDYIASYRVIYRPPGINGLGQDAQREAVAHQFGERGHLLSVFFEIESGRSHTNRPQLQAALFVGSAVSGIALPPGRESWCSLGCKAGVGINS